MPSNLSDSIKSLLDPALVRHAATTLGESTGGIEKAMVGALPTVLTGFLHHVNTLEGGENILNMAKQASESGIITDLSSLFEGSLSPAGSNMMGFDGNIFENKLTSVIRLISGYSGINETSASAVLGMMVPAALASLGNIASESNLNAYGIMTLLDRQGEDILSTIPAGLNVAGALGYLNAQDLADKVHLMVLEAEANLKILQETKEKVNESKSTNGGNFQWIIPVLIGLLLIGILYYFFKSTHR